VISQRRVLAVAARFAPLAILASVPGSALGHGGPAPPPTLLRALTGWNADPVPWACVLLAAAAYVVAVRRVNRQHPQAPVPGWRVAAWLLGLATILVALESAVDRYSDELLTVHMVQHLMLAMIAPPLLALGAPGTLALRTAGPGLRRRVLLPILHSRVVRILASPLVAWPAFTATMWFTHFSPLYDAALENPGLHLAEHGLFLATGLLFWWPIVAADPVPGRMGWGARLVYLILQMPVNAAVGLAIYFAPTLLYPHYATLVRFWGPDPLTDQQIGGVVMWGAGDLILLFAFAAVVAGWMQADVRRSQRSDRRRQTVLATEPTTQPDETALLG
jgi:putative membrane protein